MEAILGKILRNKELEEVPVEKLKEAKIIALYFAAKSCPPSRKFTELLAEFYNEVNCDAYRCEVVWASLDTEEEEYKRFLAKMPWIALPFGDPKVKDLVNRYGVTSIPKLLVFTNSMAKLTDEGRADLCTKGEQAYDKWTKLAPTAAT